jgi:hypothetical protein
VPLQNTREASLLVLKMTDEWEEGHVSLLSLHFAKTHVRFFFFHDSPFYLRWSYVSN